MKKLLICIMVFLMVFNCLPKITAHADVLTLGMLSASAFAIAESAGLSFGFTGYTGPQADAWMQGQISTYTGSRSIVEVFGTQAVRFAAGKLVLPSMVVNGIRGFLQDMIQRYGISEGSNTPTQITWTSVNGLPVYPYVSSYATKRYPLFGYGTDSPGCSVAGDSSGYTFTVYDWDGTVKGTKTWTGSTASDYEPIGWYLQRGTQNGSAVYVEIVGQKINDSTAYTRVAVLLSAVPVNATTSGSITATIPGTYSPPQGLNDLQEWEGTVEGARDTNLDDLLEDIFSQGVEGTLSVEGEVVDLPVTPTTPPQPTTVPGEDIGEVVGDIAGTLEGVQEGVESLTETAEGIAEGVTDIAEALEVPTASEMALPDLRTLFPFCIPFDLYAMVQAFNATPQAPRAQIPFNIPALGLSYTFDIDLSEFDGVASTVRTLEFVAFAAGLAVLTSRLIKW